MVVGSREELDSLLLQAKGYPREIPAELLINLFETIAELIDDLHGQISEED